MLGWLTRRRALSGIVGGVLSQHAAAQQLGAVTTLSEVISTADGGFGVMSPGRPKDDGPCAMVVVLTGDDASSITVDALDHLKKEGFLAVAADVFSGNPGDSTIMQRIDATRDWAIKLGGDVTRFGIVGFGFGGRAAWLYDAYSPTPKAVVSWFGPLQGATSSTRPMTALDAISKINAPLLGLYGKNSGTPQRLLLDVEARAKKAGKTAEIVSYVGAGRDFAVPGASFDRAATLDGWQRTVKWLRDHGVT